MSGDRLRNDSASVESLREELERLRVLFELAPDAYYLSDLKGVFLDGNKAAQELSGYHRDELIGRKFLSVGLLPVSQSARAARLLALSALGKPTGPDELTLIRKDGTKVDIEVRTIPVRIGGEVQVLGIARDLTERNRTVQALKQSEERYHRAAASGKVGVWEWDLLNNEMYVDPNLKSLLGYRDDEIANNLESWGSHVHPDDAENVMKAAEAHLSGETPHYEVEHRMLHRDGSVRWFLARGVVSRDAEGRPVRMVGSDVCITELKEAESKRQQLEYRAHLLSTQKLESLGVLAGGIAHEFNNLLTTILGNAGLVLRSLPEGSREAERAQKIERGALKAAELTSQLLAYTGRAHFATERVNLNEHLENMARLLIVSTHKDVMLERDYAANLPDVEADVSQLQQAILNLVMNASEAAASEGGRIGLRTEVVDADDELLSRAVSSSLEEGRSVCLEVRDDGAGMDEETRARAFDPFFSTKGHGRGLGLAAVLGIVRAHRGAVLLESELGKGTAVKILLPIRPETPFAAPRAEVALLGPVAEDVGAILVIDDEEGVRETAAQILEQSGFDVLTASGGRMGVELFEDHQESIGVVLLDLTMPGMEAEKVFREIRLRSNAVPVILMSGYSKEMLEDRFTGSELFIQKPFRPLELVHKIREAVERS